ncbi:CidA/LrgA family protein [Rhodobacteraceae bacterium 2CG4]|uniref:CidA/LrgA family protein n=1 Tax=Halovulum marinum TaxID=2662447 RepID=A0A6L5Z1A1_9RHOB|nr:CidA/LrgA family protein [Halovulum marinum]MSU90321.1 CidA/LrgA family protein [Halovulum marinum]
MLGAIALLLSCQLCGEVIARSLALPVPGPVLGLGLLALLFAIRPGVFACVAPVSRTILAHLSLLFVPAGVGVVANLDLLSENWLAVGAVLVVSTLLALLVSVGTFLMVLRLTGDAHG